MSTVSYRRVPAAMIAALLRAGAGRHPTVQSRQSDATGQRAITVDGKALHGSRTVDTAARHVMAACDQVTAVVLADTDIDGRTNEITRFRPLLDQIGDLRDTP
ncbi:hypothetical protein OG585_36800 [Streptomyces sp. NBC_01340]|uniref:hypothetical protein n=1 Tax=unclassified Streptomyces TaxID=2593676 RepID=UPI0022515ECB|nr:MULTISPECIES: hypothetical protein [unclassified Streptomyces]MCX4458098.1 hypothetical protein [Streptomyces sp. NBC_01719]MCX4497455.1 hypothetical protein [Streptomyces sp. NBC_01728]WSI42293.1 hypothetical protein OG585_36800 [Streptomyces sp. NBC_01340]